MWEQTVAPAILAMPAYARQTIRYRTIKCFGVGESDLEAMLPDLIRRGRDPKVGITVHQATITLRIAAAGADEAACLAAMEPTVAIIHERLGTLVFGEGDEELEHALTRLLGERGLTLATGEADAEGLLAVWLSQLPENPNYLGSLALAEPMESPVDFAGSREVAQELGRSST